MRGGGDCNIRLGKQGYLYSPPLPPPPSPCYFCKVESVLYVRNVEYTANGKKSLAQCAFLAVNLAAWDVSNSSQEENYTFPQTEGIL
jgi:hypothetical protein